MKVYFWYFASKYRGGVGKLPSEHGGTVTMGDVRCGK